MIQATPFDLPLLTAYTDKPITDLGAYEELAHHALDARLARLQDTNRRLTGNPMLSGCTLRIPVTWRLSEQLYLFWSSLPYNRFRRLRGIVMSLLAGRTPSQDLTIRLDDLAIGYTYRLIEADDFFPGTLRIYVMPGWNLLVGVCSRGTVLFASQCRIGLERFGLYPPTRGCRK